MDICERTGRDGNASDTGMETENGEKDRNGVGDIRAEETGGSGLWGHLRVDPFGSRTLKTKNETLPLIIS